jgi:Aminoglycoside-2''-adenylyltransferase
MGDLPDGVTHWDGPGLDAWRPWTPAEVADRLAGVGVPWCVVGGWSIDLFLGEETREHEDLEIATHREHLRTIRDALPDMVFHAVGDGQVCRLALDEEPPLDKHQNWVLDVGAQLWRVDVMLEPGDPQTWVYRRDERLQAPRAFMERRTGHGIPFLAPHGALFYKAKNTRPKDEADFAACLPRLDLEARAWLLDALEHQHPDHPWCAPLRRGSD